ncbi:vacuolar sorting-associated 11 homolog [Pelobates cultripes]|uniref:Vacuolar sorting-associated 11 homolog n=1 Tax=Pelobates cultripes TaxID=61616 RepID=A0AAD1T8T3_PELCU|nr:vacuolar sorting-associated 11 homolog [Pelobates cultripes]
MATLPQWRRLVFFEKEPVRLPGEDEQLLSLPPGLSVCDSGRGSLLFGDILEF